MSWIWFVVAGLASGVIAGMGMGGGTFLIPVLTIFFDIVQSKAQGINLFAFLPCAVVSLIVHIKNKLVDFKVGLPIIFAGVISSALASMLALNLKNEFLQVLFGIFLLIIGLVQGYVAIKTIIKNKTKNKIKHNVRCVYKFNKKAWYSP